MINFLPPEEKAIILKRRKTKIVSIFLILPLIFLICLAAMLFSVEHFLSKRADKLELTAREIKSALEESSVNQQKKDMDSFSVLLQDLSKFYSKKIYFSETLEKISQIMPEGTYLTNLSIIHEIDEGLNLTGYKVEVSGFSPTREKLTELKLNAEKVASFEGVIFPLSSWVKPDDISFSFTFKIPMSR